MRNKFIVLSLLISFLNSSCSDYKKNLKSKDINEIMKACYKLGEARDTSAVKLLLTEIIDWRMSTNMRFKGMTVYQCKVGALSKISGIEVFYDYKPDTAVSNVYLNWAIQQGFIKNKGEIDLYYEK
ncbi:MAG TPA: hypothetical protein VK498_02350 [Ferruginibacter sp.]|nr:hypothetical protein [Ferruginibacter sp.]